MWRLDVRLDDPEDEQTAATLVGVDVEVFALDPRVLTVMDSTPELRRALYDDPNVLEIHVVRHYPEAV